MNTMPPSEEQAQDLRQPGSPDPSRKLLSHTDGRRKVTSITITCEGCGQRHRLERKRTEPGNIYIVCHRCELPLRAWLEVATSGRPEPNPVAAFDLNGWASVLDLGTP